MTMVPTKQTYLSMMDIFQDLSPAEIDRLAHATVMVTCERGRVFYHPAEPIEVLFLLKRGEVAISRISSDGRKLVVDTLTPGAVFGEMVTVGQRMHETVAEALTDCLICVMSRADVETLLLADARVAVRLIQALSARLARAEARLEEMAFKGVPARLASLLLRLSTETDWRGRRGLTGLTHQQLAELVGSHRETVTAILNQFRATGLIEIGRRRITLLDATGLAAIVDD